MFTHTHTRVCDQATSHQGFILLSFSGEEDDEDDDDLDGPTGKRAADDDDDDEEVRRVFLTNTSPGSN